jgi:LysR family hydrogen peroxide-inducible transcriptional activator
MTLNQLELLISIADRGSVSAAADFFGLTQPTVSRHVQLLEEELGVELLQRKSRGMALTEAGELVVAEARPIIQRLRTIPVRVQELKDTVEGTVMLGLSPVSPVSTHHFPAIYQEFHQRYPKVTVSVIEEGSAELVANLHEHVVDLAIMSLPVLGSRVEITPLWREELVLIEAAGVEHPEQHKLEHFRDRPWILFRAGFGLASAVRALCQTAGFDPKAAAEGSSLSAVIGFVASGLGVSVVPREAALEHQRSGRVQIVDIEPPMARTMALVTSSDAVLNPAARAMADVIWAYSRNQDQPETIQTGYIPRR